MVVLSRTDIEWIAQRVIRAYKKLPVLEDRRIYNISPQILLDHLLKLKTDYCHLSLDRLTLGATIPRVPGKVEIFNASDESELYILDGRTVLIEQDLRDDISQAGRLNMTKAHEAGHHILEMLFPGEYSDSGKKLRYCKEKSKPVIGNWEEWQVDTLASAILMPEDIVRQALLLFGFDERIPMINRIHAKRDYKQFSMIADFLGVSKQALSIKLSRLGLVGRNDFDDPNSLLDIFHD